MKRNDWAVVLSVFIYSILFYKQTAGINFFLFNIVLIGLLIFRDPQVLKSKIWLSVAAGALVSSFFIFMYGSALAIWANLFSLFIISALSIDPATSFLTGIFLTLCWVSSSCVFMFIDWVNRKSKQITENYRRPFYVKIFLFLIPFLIAILFFVFYQNANPLFYDFTKNINLDFISFPWIMFTISGLLLMYGFFHNRKMPGISDADRNAKLELDEETASRTNFLNSLMRTDTENLSGIVLFSMLNLLLLLLNILDINYFLFDGKLPKGISHKAFVHDGIGTLITSLVIAILIMLFYFRGTLNYYKGGKWLRILALFWIAQNAFMIFSTAYRNNLYIEESGISYKKIGVYVYLLLTLIGLSTTLIKILRLKTNWYLFRVNAMACYFFLVIGCTMNWDVYITDFNIRKYTDEHKKLEKYLLMDLSYKNLPQLLKLPASVANADDPEARDYYNFLRETNYYSYKTGLSMKLYNFLEEYQKMEWPSLCSEKKRVYNALYEMRDNVDSLEFRYFYKTSLKPLEMFRSLRSLKLESSDFSELKELSYFPKLENLDISGETTHFKSLTPLLKLHELKHLKIGRISSSGLESLKRALQGVQIEVTETYSE